MLRFSAVMLIVALALTVSMVQAQTQPVATPAPAQPSAQAFNPRVEPPNPLHQGDPAQYVLWATPFVVGALVVGVVLWNRIRNPRSD